MAPPIDHRDNNLSIYQMVLNRLPFILDNEHNKRVISNFTLELMYQLNPCFKLKEDEIGQEQFYTVTMQSIIADILCIYILLGAMSANFGNGQYDNKSGGGSETENPQNTFISLAEAGSVRVEYDQFDWSKSQYGSLQSLRMSAPDLINMWKASAVSKAGSIGCYLSIFDDGSLQVGCYCGNPALWVIPYKKC